jgi:hypothetical protein
LRGAARAQGSCQQLTRRAALAAGGLLIGIAFGIGTRYVLRWMRHLGAGIEQQVALTFALGYLSFYTANGPAAVSGAPPNPTPTLPGRARHGRACCCGRLPPGRAAQQPAGQAGPMRV